MEDKKAEEMRIAEESLEEVSGGVTPLIRRQRPLPPRCPNCGSKDCRVDPNSPILAPGYYICNECNEPFTML